MLVRVFDSLHRGQPARNFWRAGRSEKEPATGAGAQDPEIAEEVQVLAELV
jgi:hypothetical protein